MFAIKLPLTMFGGKPPKPPKHTILLLLVITFTGVFYNIKNKIHNLFNN